MINLLELNYKDEIKIDENIDYSNEYIKNTDIIKLKDVSVKGTIKKDDFYIVSLVCSGIMYLHDSLTYDEIPYEFSVKIDENLENSLKSIDLIEFLWHYIVLEIPLRYTLSDIKTMNKNGVDIMSEEEYKNKFNPFKDFHLE